jgi:hypothetical protein
VFVDAKYVSDMEAWLEAGVGAVGAVGAVGVVGVMGVTEGVGAV